MALLKNIKNSAYETKYIIKLGIGNSITLQCLSWAVGRLDFVKEKILKDSFKDNKNLNVRYSNL